jgi:hypothetical protein
VKENSLRRLPVLALAAILAAEPAFAAGNPGVTAAPILQMPVGARAVGMAGAFTGVADDATALYYNPAGLSNLTHREVTFMYLKAFADQNVEFIAGATPLQLPGLIGDGYSALATSVLFAQNGTIEVNRTNATGQLISSESLSAGSDFVATVGYSERVAHFEIPTRDQDITFHHYMGLSGKWIRSTLAEQYSASTFATDLGYFLRVPEWRLTGGFSVLNLGGDMTFIEEGDPLPLTLAVGLGYDPVLPDSFITRNDAALLVALDAEYLSRERQWQADFGLEYSMLRRHAVRLGYRFNRDIVGLTFGFGTAWRGIEFDYAWGLTSELSDTHRFSVTYRFGRVSAQRREKKKRPFIERMPDRDELRGIEEATPVQVDPPKRRPRRRPRRERVAPGWIY